MPHLHVFSKAFCVALLLLFSNLTLKGQTGGWQTLPNFGIANGSTRFEDIYFVDSMLGFAVQADGDVNKTTDGGTTWQHTHMGNYQMRSIDICDHIGVIGTLDGFVVRSLDLGNSWQDVSFLVADTGADVRRMCGLAHFGTTFYGVGWWGAAQGRFYKSTDTGMSWTVTYVDTSLATGLVDVIFLSQDTGYITGCKNTTGNYLLANESVILKTTNGGNTWTKVFSDTTIGGRIWKIQFLNDSTGFASVEPYYDPDTVNILKTTDRGNSWHFIHVGRVHNTTMPSYPVGTQGVCFATEQKGWAGGYYYGLFETSNGGATWDTLSFGSNFNRMQRMSDRLVYAGGTTMYVWRDTSTATAVGNPLKPNTTSNKLFPITPNPSSGALKIEYDIKYPTNVVMEIANIASRRHVQVFNKRLKPGHYTTEYDMSNMPNGNYIVWMGTDEIPLTQKFTLLR
ncbi:MAG: hypothetical protein JSS82_01205 [Bacteroidetes bacterium]|nr:hypothetical protein [Bacteroidota bacterium]